MSGAEPLCAQERETISRELSRGNSARCIGKLLGRHHSTIVREIGRNGGAADYRALAAQERYESFKTRPKERKLVAGRWAAVAPGAGERRGAAVRAGCGGGVYSTPPAPLVGQDAR
ncbi:MAG: helix-turn-helix domain-containing protein [Pseudonocardia sp.]